MELSNFALEKKIKFWHEKKTDPYLAIIDVEQDEKWH